MSPGHVGFPFILRNFALANWNLPAIIFCSSPGHGWRVRNRIDVSVLAVGNRAFVFAASPYFVAGNLFDEMQGSRFCWCGSARARQRQQKILASFRGGARIGQIDKRRKNNS